MSATRAVASAGGFGSSSVRDKTSETNRFGAKVGANEWLAASWRIAFGEDEIDCSQHGIEPLGHFARVRNAERNSRIANFSLRAHESLGHRCGGNEKRARDFISLKPAESAQRERNLRFERQAPDGSR